MKRIEFNEIGGIDVLQQVEREIPEPAPDEVVVQIKACGLNRAEYLFFQGQYLFQPNVPAKLGMEASGIIHTVGEAVTNYETGDEVCLLPNIDMTAYGFLGEYARVPQSALVRKPSGLNFEEAAAFWMSYGTAYGLLVQKGQLQKNTKQTVLITAASSSVGVACIQLAKKMGAAVIASTRTSLKKEFLLAAGADHVVATKEESLVERVLEITDGRGFDFAVDAISGPITQHLAEAAAEEAQLVVYGVLDPRPVDFPLYPALTKGINLTGFHYVFHLLDQPERRQQMIDFLENALQQDLLQPQIDRVFSFEDTEEAYRYMESDQQRGKIVVAM